jgi:hypothetical protein
MGEPIKRATCPALVTAASPMATWQRYCLFFENAPRPQANQRDPFRATVRQKSQHRDCSITFYMTKAHPRLHKPITHSCGLLNGAPFMSQPITFYVRKGS